jgi:hypothetical protein
VSSGFALLYSFLNSGKIRFGVFRYFGEEEIGTQQVRLRSSPPPPEASYPYAVRCAVHPLAVDNDARQELRTLDKRQRTAALWSILQFSFKEDASKGSNQSIHFGTLSACLRKR